MAEVVLYDPQGATHPTEVDVFFIHGLLGDRLGTWSKGKICWPRDILKDDLPRARIVTWGYDSRVLDKLETVSQASLFGHSENLLADIARLRRGVPDNRPIIFVGHSLGGLVIKEALIRSAQYHHNAENPQRGKIYPATKGVVFLGTPHRGSDMAGLGLCVANIFKAAFQKPNKKLVQSLEKDSDVLENQRKGFASISQGRTKPILIGNIYEEDHIHGVGVIVVPQYTAVMNVFGERTASVPENHSNMCKFASKEDLGYLRVSDIILEFATDAVNTLQQEQELEIAKKLQDLVDSLKFPAMGMREERIADAYAGTFRWILHPTCTDQISAFANWLGNPSPEQSIFWLSGKPASGKSTLMKYIYSEERDRLRELLKAWAPSGKLIIAGWYFSDEGESALGKNQEGLLRTLLHQILSQDEGMRHRVLRDKLKKIDWTQDFKITSINWTRKDLWTAFELALKQAAPGTKFHIFVDGLDECSASDSQGNIRYGADDDDDGIEARLRAHREIANLFLKVASADVKCCLSSRSQNPFESIFDQSSKAGLRYKLEDLTEVDVRNLVTGQLQGHARLDELEDDEPGFKDEIIKSLIEKTEGVFTWVILVIQRIINGVEEGDEHSEVREFLQHVPAELDGKEGLYMSLLKNIRKNHRQEAAKYLEVMMTARHALGIAMFSFTVENPNAVLQSGIRIWSSEELRKHERRWEIRIKSRSAGLLQVKPHTTRFGHPQPIVRFIHLTVKEFLRKHNVWNMLNEDEAVQFDTDLALLGASLLVLKRRGVRPHLDSEDMWVMIHDAVYYAGRVEAGTGRSPIALLDDLDETVTRLLSEYCSPEDSPFDALISREEFFQHGLHWVSLEPQEQGGKLRSPTDNFLSYAVWGNLHGYLASKLPQQYQRSDADPNPLLASYSWYIPARPLLWLAVAPPDPPSLLNYDSTYGDSLGVNQSDVCTVQLLLSRGHDPWEMVQDMTIWDHMICWVPNRHTAPETCWHDAHFMALMKVMIEHGANPNAVGAHMRSLLFMAITCAKGEIERKEREELVHILRSKGAELFPGELAILLREAPWVRPETLPVMEKETYEEISKEREGLKGRYPRGRRRLVPSSRTLREIRRSKGIRFS